MIEWKVVILAFFVGMTLVLLLEARNRFRRFDWQRGIWVSTGAAFMMALILGQFITLLNTPKRRALINKEVTLASFVVAEEVIEDTVVSLLPPPSIFTYSATQTSVTPIPRSQPAILSVPDLAMQATIIDVPLQDGSWDVSSLGEQVGRLQGVGQYPGDELAMVFAGHMTFPSSQNLMEGAFANLQYAIYGTELFLEMDGERMVYEVAEISRVAPDEVDKLVVKDGDSILLVTCTDWDENGRVYANRLLVRAERVMSGK